MVILACAFLESILSTVFIHVAERHGMSTVQAMESVEKIRGFGDKPSDRNSFPRFFHTQTGLSLEQEFEKFGYREFWDAWKACRKDRNDILHGKLPFAPVDTRNRVAILLDISIPVFVRLQNEHGVLPRKP